MSDIINKYVIFDQKSVHYCLRRNLLFGDRYWYHCSESPEHNATTKEILTASFLTLIVKNNTLNVARLLYEY